MKRLYFFCVLLVLSFLANSQTGNSFLTHYAPSDERIDYRSMGMLQDSRGLIYFTNKKGVLEFDGRNWRLIPTPGAVYTLSIKENVVYVGGVFGFGKLLEKGSERMYEPIINNKIIFSSVVANGKVYGCSETSIVSISAEKVEKEIKIEAGNSIRGLFEIYDRAFVKSSSHNILEVKPDTLVKADIALPLGSEVLFSNQNPKSREVILGDESGKVYLIKEKTSPIEIMLQDAAYVRQNSLSNGVWVNEKMIALGTLLGGVLLVDVATGATVDHLDFTTGLPDNEVFALMTDQSEGVWVAHEYGFTRIAPSLPFRSFNHFPGLNGNLLCIRSIQGQVYVGTTLGLYRLTKEETNRSVAVQTINSSQKERIGLFGFSQKIKNGKSTADAKPTFETKIIKPIGYSYKKVNGIEGKVVQMIEVNGKLIIAGLGGVFEINGDKAKSIIGQPVKTIFFSPSLQQLMVGTYNNQIKTFLDKPTAWSETHLLDTLSDHISYAFEDNLQNIWLCGRSEVYRVETVDGKISDAASFPVNNPSLDEMVGVAYGNEVYLAASGEFKKFDHKNSFVRYDSLPGPHRYFASAGYFWFNDGAQWRTVDSRLRTLKLQWLGLFPNLRFLAPDENAQSLWVITADNELYKFTNSQLLSDDVHYPLLLREVKGQEIKIGEDKGVTMDQSENELSFEFIQPDYVSSHAMQYRYQVKGLTNGWTAWSSTNHIANFPYLPPGSYQLAMQSRDVLGNESKIELIPFQILPPYWKRWWFYAFEFSFFSLLMILSVKLSVANSKYQFVSQILSLLTVIIFIQFIQTGINSLLNFKSSPVIDFFIQVFIALVVFPLEAYFTKFMRGAAEGKYHIRIKKNPTINN